MAFYARTHQQHWLRDKHVDGIVVILDDDSMWELHPSDRWLAVRWLRMSTIIVENTRTERYPYLLKNTPEEETSRASYLGDLGPMKRSEVG